MREGRGCSPHPQHPDLYGADTLASAAHRASEPGRPGTLKRNSNSAWSVPVGLGDSAPHATAVAPPLSALSYLHAETQEGSWARLPLGHALRARVLAPTLKDAPGGHGHPAQPAARGSVGVDTRGAGPARWTSLQAVRGRGGRGHARGGACAPDLGKRPPRGARRAWAREGRGLRAGPRALSPGGAREVAAGGVSRGERKTRESRGAVVAAAVQASSGRRGGSGGGAAGLGAGGRFPPSAVRVRAALCFASQFPSDHNSCFWGKKPQNSSRRPRRRARASAGPAEPMLALAVWGFVFGRRLGQKRVWVRALRTGRSEPVVRP